MADRHPTGQNGEPVPRDLPDQQVTEGEDPLDVPLPAAEEDEPASGVPDTDEAGTGPQGERRSATVHPEHPAPEESSA
ncbi:MULTISPECIES: hypothetical protein [Streptomyces]|uniref:Uncharacterized protein n=1 Tax=Streptomyces gilvifuscus TaxID=1550617 RepID=A0ABT5FPB7_9ACTN|nr:MULTISPECIES: hypothetical protein [Streptomyces]MBK3647568.1 hypothetical protein [Streptomyces sp. MBT33]MDC2954389.1 hypothetical protein [Streptomyces gilvifuscus]